MKKEVLPKRKHGKELIRGDDTHGVLVKKIKYVFKTKMKKQYCS